MRVSARGTMRTDPCQLHRQRLDVHIILFSLVDGLAALNNAECGYDGGDCCECTCEVGHMTLHDILSIFVCPSQLSLRVAITSEGQTLCTAVDLSM